MKNTEQGLTIRSISKTTKRPPRHGIFIEKVGENAKGEDVYSIKTIIVGQQLINFNQMAGRDAVMTEARRLQANGFARFKVYEVTA